MIERREKLTANHPDGHSRGECRKAQETENGIFDIEK
jgi:hypothetical protein